MLTLYHWAPRSRRRSIQREGLRRLSWNGGSLVLFAIAPCFRLPIREHVADRHDCSPDHLDLWRFTVSSADVTRLGTGVYQVRIDVPCDRVERLLTAADFKGAIS